MKITIKYSTADGEYVVTTSMMEIVQMERHFDVAISALASGISMDQIGYLAWRSSQAAGNKPPARYDDFLKSITAIEVVENSVAVVGPTEAGQ
jgi:hypothetical protein